MFKTVTREITLFVQARSGLSTAAAVSAIVIVIALLVAFAFLCAAAYARLALLAFLAAQWARENREKSERQQF